MFMYFFDMKFIESVFSIVKVNVLRILGFIGVNGMVRIINVFVVVNVLVV